MLYRTFKFSGAAGQSYSTFGFLCEPPEADHHSRTKFLCLSYLRRQSQPAMFLQETDGFGMAREQFGQHKGSFFQTALCFQSLKGLPIKIAQIGVELSIQSPCRSR